MSDSKLAITRQRNHPAQGERLRKSEQTRQAILDAALDFLWSHPFRDLKVGPLMAAAGASRSAFYQYFADLHDLIESLLGDLQAEILAAAEPWFLHEGEPKQLLDQSLRSLIDVCHQRGPIVRAVVEAAPMDARLEKAWSQFLKVFDDAVADRIRTHQAQGLIDSFDPQPIAIALNRMDVGVVIQHFGRRPRTNPDIVYASVRRIWIATLYNQ